MRTYCRSRRSRLSNRSAVAGTQIPLTVLPAHGSMSRNATIAAGLVPVTGST